MRVSFCQSYIRRSYKTTESWEGNIYIIRSGHETLKRTTFMSMKDSWPPQISNNMNKTSRYKHKTKNLIEIYILLIYGEICIVMHSSSTSHYKLSRVCWKFAVKFLILFSYYKQYNQMPWHTKYIKGIHRNGIVFLFFHNHKKIENIRTSNS